LQGDRELLNPWLTLIVVLALWALYRMLRFRFGWKLPPAIQAVMEPYRRGDYKASLAAVEGLRRDNEVTHNYCYYRGAILAHLGRLDEAEVWLRRSIAMRAEDNLAAFRAISHTTLGQLMLQAGRYDEAEKCFQSSMQCNPNRGSPYRSLAELCLLRRGNPEEAMRLAKMAIVKEQANHLTLEIRKLSRGEQLATLAWATAAGTHNSSEVARLVAEAIENVGSGNVQSTAEVQYHSGCAYTELGDIQAGVRHYEAAARIDRQGHWGRLAQAALEATHPQSR